MIDRSQSSEVVIRGDGDGFRSDNSLILALESQNTAIIGSSFLNSQWKSDDISDLAIACRVFLQMSNHLTWFRDDFLPAEESGLDAFSQIIIADDRIIDDFAAMSTLRQWVHSGGHAWVMLDRVDAAVLEMLLGDEFSGSVVDRTTLTTIKVEEGTRPDGERGKLSNPVTFDDPVDFVQMAADHFDVTHRVNGWPAAMTIPCGDGVVLVTTLGARAWVRPYPEGNLPSSEPHRKSNFLLTEPMTDVADVFFRLRKPELLKSDFVQPQAEEYIGYSIPAWSVIAGTLLFFSVSIILIGLYLLHFNRLEQICWIGTIPAVAVSLFLIQTGRANRHAIPGTISTVEMVQASQGTDDVRSHGVISVYHPDGSDALISATAGGRLKFEESQGEQGSYRLVTTDLGAWQLENLRQTSGVQTASFTHSTMNPERIVVRATFDSQGVNGSCSGVFSTDSDAIIATQTGRMGLTFSSDGSFQGRQSDVFTKDQFLSARLLSDEQDRRRRTLKELLDNPERPDYPSAPQILYWADPRDNGFQFGPGLEHRGASLVAVPLMIDRPAAASEILIPSPFLAYFGRPSPDGSPSSAMWNSETKQWQERSEPGVAWLSFPIFRQLLPLTPLQVTVEMKVAGPIGVVEILGLRNGSVASLASLTNPVGSVTIDISDPEALTIENSGSLVLGISAGTPVGSVRTASESAVQPSNFGEKVNYWRIESMAVQLRARTSDALAKD